MAKLLDKKLLREEIKQTLKSLSTEYIHQQSAQLSKRVLDHPNLPTFKACSVYLSMPKEVQTGALVEAMFNLGKIVYVPKVVGPNNDDMLMPRVFSHQEIETFPKSKWMIPELTMEQVRERPDGIATDNSEELIDVVLTPGVAFNSKCERIGHGKGYYDSFLTRLNDRRAAAGLGPVTTIGLALDEQIVDEVPVDSHDVPLNFVVTPTRIFSQSNSPTN